MPCVSVDRWGVQEYFHFCKLVYSHFSHFQPVLYSYFRSSASWRVRIGKL